MEIQTTTDSPFACNPNGMTSEQRKNYQALMNVLDLKARPRTEVTDGFSFTLPKTSEVIRGAAEWITYEMLCCPFLSFSLIVEAANESVSIGLHGPDGVKSFLRSEFDLS